MMSQESGFAVFGTKSHVTNSKDENIRRLFATDEAMMSTIDL